MELDVPDNADLHAAVQYALNRIDAILEKTGVQPIDGERTYSPLRHVPVPPGPVRKGTPIARTLRKGWCIGGKVLRKARIETDAMPAAEATGIVP
ncbi:MAG: hypothetical protein IK066_01330 [Kiritimatiellae bacterium]|nr:hypothetical protein [Kiritimatiellia bacterium]